MPIFRSHQLPHRFMNPTPLSISSSPPKNFNFRTKGVWRHHCDPPQSPPTTSHLARKSSTGTMIQLTDRLWLFVVWTSNETAIRKFYMKGRWTLVHGPNLPEYGIWFQLFRVARVTLQRGLKRVTGNVIINDPLDQGLWRLSRMVNRSCLLWWIKLFRDRR